MSKREKLRSQFNLGGEQAEADSLLSEAFYESGEYQAIASRADKRCFLIGRTGSGKSAALQRLEDTKPDHVIRITPEDLSLPYITDLQLVSVMKEIGVDLDLFWKALWKHILIVEVLRHRYRVKDQKAKESFLSQLRSKISRDPSKKAALEYLDEFDGRFWCETDERVREITDGFTRKIERSIDASSGGSSTSVGGRIGRVSELSQSERSELQDRFQRVVNETQLARLSRMVAVLDEDILGDQHFTYVVVDDLDREWVDSDLSNDLIRCLFSSVLDLKRAKNLKILVALRTNIFQELDFGRKGGQEEKFRSLVLDMKWTPATLEELLDDRVAARARETGEEYSRFSDFLPKAKQPQGAPIKYIMDRTLLRPRDAISFANEILAAGVGYTRLSWDGIRKAEESYSPKRLLALRDEWKPTYPDIDRAIEAFRGSPSEISRNELTTRLDDVAVLLADSEFRGCEWLDRATAPIWSGADGWAAMYRPLVSIFYTIGLLGCSSDGRSFSFYNDFPLAIESDVKLEKMRFFYIHWTYASALEVTSSRASN